MSRQLHINQAAEREANEIAFRFMDSSDVVGDMSRAYGADLSSVRIHTGESAAQKVEGTGADALSTGKDIFFGQGVFDQGNPAGRGLLAHELAHSLQQGVGGGMEGAVEQSVPEGAEQGGPIDWFKRHFTAKGRAGRKRANLIRNTAVPEARVGESGDEESARNFALQLATPDVSGTAAGKSFIQMSNESVRSGQSRSAALVNLGIRGSQNASARAEAAMRGTTYAGLGQNYADYLYALQEGGLDTNAMLQDEELTHTDIQDVASLAHATGASYDVLNSKALEMFSSYVLSDESLDYLENFAQGVAPAEVFGGQLGGLTGASGFALQSVVNTAGGNIAAAYADPRLNAGSKGVAKNMGRTIGSLPAMANLDENQIPKSLRPLRAQYIQLQEEVDRRLAERRAQRQGG